MARLCDEVRDYFTVHDHEPARLERANTWKNKNDETHLYDQDGRHYSIATTLLQELTGTKQCGVVLEISGFRHALTSPRTIW